ncbi:MAG: ribonuclease Y [Psychrilyobacter sp.]|nr:ribonuclease Y [Psychrilyobacter sp.]
MNTIIIIAAVIVAGGILSSVLYKKSVIEKKISELNNLEDSVEKARQKAERLEKRAVVDAESKAKEITIKAKENAYSLKEDAEKEIKTAKNEILQKENRLIKREETLDNKLDRIDAKTLEVQEYEKELNSKEKEIDILKSKQEEELERVAELSREDAKNILLDKLKDDLIHDSAVMIRSFEHKLDEEKDRMTQKILSTAIGKASAEFVSDATVSVVQLPNDEMKGRIIGREGRNIRTIEQLTGVDIIIDDTPEAVVLSCFDGVKREIARNALDKLVNDGRIHPTKIEEAIKKATSEVDKGIKEAGEHALFELGITGVHPEVIKVLGSLKFRTSYGQNVLTHSIEVGHIAATLAAEIGADVKLAKRSGLFHDIGKVLTHETETSHGLLGAEFLRKFGEKDLVANGAESHHHEVEFRCIESVLVQAADAISASRPGARRETLNTYIKRLEELEAIATSFEGVESSYAIQAGREMRIIINPNIVSDDKTTILAREVAKKIEENMQYPGQIKVTVVRETRSVEYAK